MLDNFQIKCEKLAGIGIVGDPVVFRCLLCRAERDQGACERNTGLKLGNQSVKNLKEAFFQLHTR